MGKQRVTLEKYEFEIAKFVGQARNNSAMAKGSKDHFTLRKGEESEDLHIIGACGEVAVAKYLNIFWDGSVNTYKTSPDLKPSLEVKTTRNPEGDLYIKNHESLEQRFILVARGVKDKFAVWDIVGWFNGVDAPPYITENIDGKSCYKVPKEKLHDIKELLI